jgi:KUP system potassium uptake protein
MRGRDVSTLSEPVTIAQSEPRLSRAALLGALGIVFGDIGTSPLYAFRESLRSIGESGGAPPDHVLGILSLIFWSLILIVTIKYVVIVLRATNEGEGGIMALTALAADSLPAGRWREAAFAMGLIGVALFYGDCILTPAISVLSAVEGLKVATPIFEHYVVPISAGILAGLFLLQSRGTARIGRLFGPIVAIWFVVLAISGIYHIALYPGVLVALHPGYALSVIEHLGFPSFYVLGAVFLAVTGGEALYADVGHFSKRIIRVDWFALVLPALTLNYLGQGALVLRTPEAAASPFFMQFNEYLLIPVVALATAATVIASQAVITGAFTLSQQAMVLRFLPRLETRFTSKTHAGQVYVPQINWLLAVAVLTLVITFGSSEALASAYGIAVVTTMLSTTLLVGAVACCRWDWPLAIVIAVTAFFFAIDFAFFTANLLKIADGGWIPIMVGALLFATMRTWQQGRSAILEKQASENAPLKAFWDRMNCKHLLRVPGTAIYLTSRNDAAPSALVQNIKHNKCLHETVVLLTVLTERHPRVLGSRLVLSEELEQGFRRVTLRFGFAEQPNVPKALREVTGLGFKLDEANTSFFIGREIPIGSPRPDLAAWQEPIFRFLTKNAGNAADFFHIAPDKVVELGTQIEV